MGCPEPEMLAQLAGAGGDPQLRAALADHAASCESCHAALLVVLEVSPVAETVAEPVAGTVGGLPPRLERVDRYVIKRRLGAGGMGVVYEASDPELGRSIAIKMLRRGAPAARLRREAQALARLDHRNVVAVHDVGEHDGQTFIAMALVDGENLRAWLATERTTEAILAALVGAARGLAAAHAAGLVHRDLKPDNIFVAHDGNVMVGDFGLARDASDDDDRSAERRTRSSAEGDAKVNASPAAVGAASTNLTMTGMVLGTPAYMAPEQAQGTATARSDQFSFCVMAYEALFGCRPFAGDTFDEVLANVRAGAIAPPKRPRKVPARVVRALRRGLAADPEQRHASMLALVTALEPPRRRWTRWAVPLGAAAIAAIVTVAIATRSARGPDCASTRGELASTWNPGRRITFGATLRARGIPPGGASDLVAKLDDNAARWIAVRAATCVEAGQDRLSRDQQAARTACLGARRDDLAAAVTAIASGTDDAFAAWHRLAALWPVESCRDDASARLAVGDAAHQQLMHAIAALDPITSDTRELVALRPRAEAAGDRAALLVIDLGLGIALVDAGATAEADIHLQNALAIAERLGAAPERQRALAALARSACKQGRFDASEPLLVMADAGVQRDAAGALATDDVMRARAECLTQRRAPQAIAVLDELLARSIAHYGADSVDQLDLHLQLMHVYNALDRPEDSQRETATFDRILARVVAPNANAAEREEVAARSAMEQGDLDGAIAHERRTAELWGEQHPTERAVAASSLAIYYEMAAEWRAAAAAHAEVVRIVPPDSPGADLRSMRIDSLVSSGTMALTLGDLATAATAYGAAETEARVLGRPDLVTDAELGLGRVAVERGDFVRGARLLRDALAAYIKRADASAYRIGVAQFAFARALWETGDHASAVAAAAQAETAVAKGVDDAKQNPLGGKLVAGRSELLAKVAAWRDSHR